MPVNNDKHPPKKTTNAPKALGSKLTKTQKKKDEEEAVDTRDGVDELRQVKGLKLKKPEDQLKLTEAELSEEITRVLTTHNPHAPQNIVQYSFKEGSYKQLVVDHTVVLFELDSGLVDRFSDEGRRLMLKEGLLKEDATVDKGETSDEDRTETPATPVDDGGVVEDAGEEDRPDSAASRADKKQPKHRNLFNYSERPSQTLNNHLRDVSCQTEPPPCISFSATANQCEIYDAYVQELQKQEKNKEEQKAALSKKDHEKNEKKTMPTETQRHDLSKVVTILERMVNQSIYDDIAQDFKYFEDPSDEFRGQVGTVLPLWKFKCDGAKRLTVTALCWNNKYPDLFGVGMGSYDFCKQGGGMLLFYSLKNPPHPEYIYPTASGVQCIDIHRERSYLVAVGFYDGCVAVYNLKKKGSEPVYKSNAKTGQHLRPVWQVCWQNDDMDGNHNFFSVSSDSRVVSWTTVKNELIFTDIITLSTNKALPDGSQQLTTYGGISFDFHKKTESEFLVGTDQGKILKCSKAYSSRFLKTYETNNISAVNAVKWNHFHPHVFISCNFGWTVNIWEETISSPMFTFNLKADVGDVAWAPYSSTVFAAVTIDGTVHVFDLDINKNEAVCQQSVVAKKTKLTHIKFSPIHPIIIVGDDQGCVTSLKLSPNLRHKPKLKKGQEHLKSPEEEVDKMEKLLTPLKQSKQSYV